jgi:hypothetical protein
MKKSFSSVLIFCLLGCGEGPEIKSTDPTLAPGTPVDPRIKLMTTKSKDVPSVPVNEK